MSLSSILELCEQHMSEGDYLNASNILKNIHNNTPIPCNERTILLGDLKLEKNFNDYESRGDNDYWNFFVIKKVIQKQIHVNYWKTEEIICNFCGHDLNIKWNTFSKVLKNYLKTNLWTDFTLYGYFERHQKFDMISYMKFYHNRANAIYRVFIDEDDDSPDYDDEISYDSFITYSVKLIKEYIEIKIDT